MAADRPDLLHPTARFQICATRPAAAMLSAILSFCPTWNFASEFDSTVPMRDKGASTFYAPCSIEGYGEVEMLVDTGSAYTTINEQTLEVLQERGLVTYVKDLDAKMADGSSKVVPVYRIASIYVGDDCEIEDVEAAVLPGNTRSLLGLSALSKAGPIIFSADPPRLTLSNCTPSSKNDE